MYYLRNRRPDPNKKPQDMISDRNLKVILKRDPVLEDPANLKNTFVLKNDEVLKRKMKGDSEYDVMKIYILLIILFFFLMVVTMCFYKDTIQTYGNDLKKRTVCLKGVRSFINCTVIGCYQAWSSVLGKNAEIRQVKKGKITKSGKRKNKKGVCYNDIRDFLVILAAEKEVPRNNVRSQLSFIEEQCRVFTNLPIQASNFQSVNISEIFPDVDTYPNFASYAKGARILSTSHTEPYVVYGVNLFGFHYFKIDDVSICRFSQTLCQYFVNGPTSVLQPWKKAGECWAFKGSHGRVLIQLSDSIYIKAISLEHIPQDLTTPESSRSAPKRLSVIGIDDSTNYKFTERIYLGTYEYQLEHPNVQIFYLSDEDSLLPFKIVEFIFESNHGNPNYTCVYRIRVHGHKR